MVRLRIWPLVPVMPALVQVKVGALPETVAANQVDPPLVLYWQPVSAVLLEKVVAKSKGLLTKPRYCRFDGVTVPGTGAPVEAVEVTVRLLVPEFPAASRAVTVMMLVPALSATDADQDVVPEAV